MGDNSLINLGEISKPATVLIEKISDAVGGIFKPYQIVRVAKAEAEAERVKAEAQIQISDLQRRAFHRFLEEEAKKQKNMEDIREKAVLVFNSWEADKVRVKRGDLVLTVVKNAEDKWLFEDGGKEADKSKVETFIRKIEGLEAAEFIDAPAGLQEYGLAPPQVEVTVWTKSGEKEKEFQVLFGTEDQEKKQVVVKNPKLEYLFRVDSSVLGDFPKAVKDWTPAPPEDKSDEKKEEKKGDDQ